MTITDRTGEDDDTFEALLARVEAAEEVDAVADMRDDYGITCDCLGPPFYACVHWPALDTLRGEGRQA